MFKTRAMAVLVSTLVAIVCALSASSPAQAEVGASLGVPFSWLDGNTGISTLPVTFTAGDCRLEGTNQTDPEWARIQLVTVNAATNQYQLKWDYSMYTVSTWRGDIWHARFRFNSPTENIFEVSTDAPLIMINVFVEYRLHWLVNFTLTPSQVQKLASINSVTWIGDC